MQTGKQHTQSERGFLMVALLVGMAVAAIYMTAALPAWRQQAVRDKEAELIFRGRQYARAIMLYQEKNRNALPPDIDILVSQHFLRKKWKDPITGEDFVPIGVGVTPGSGTQPGASGGQNQPGRPSGTSPSGGTPLSSQEPGVQGVRSKSTATSIKIYEQQQQYSLWPFDAARIRAQSGRNVQQQQPGQGQQPGAKPGGPGGPGTGGPGGQPPRVVPGGPGGRAGSGPPPPPPRPGGAAGS